MFIRFLHKISFVIIGLALTLPSICHANICDDAAKFAARKTGVPDDVLRTISRVETAGYRGSKDPWPWAINHAGDSNWFSSEDDARTFVFSKVKAGATNIDIGCYQINYRWHRDGFRDLDAMFDPSTNALYAAQFLSQLYQEFGNWTDAAGAYHSRTPEFAEPYKSNFTKLRTSLSASFPSPSSGLFSAASMPRNGIRNSGSLFHARTSGAQPLFDLGGNR